MSAQEMVVVLFFIPTGHCFEGLIADVLAYVAGGIV